MWVKFQSEAYLEAMSEGYTCWYVFDGNAYLVRSLEDIANFSLNGR